MKCSKHVFDTLVLYEMLFKHARIGLIDPTWSHGWKRTCRNKGIVLIDDASGVDSCDTGVGSSVSVSGGGYPHRDPLTLPSVISTIDM